MKKYLISLILCLSLFSCFAMTAFAIDSPNVVARLSTSMSVAQSVTTAGTHKFYGGKNSANSKHKVYFEAQKSSGDKFVKDSSKLVGKGENIDNVLTNFTGSTVLWRLELNPYRVGTKGCSATGYMWYLM